MIKIQEMYYALFNFILYSLIAIMFVFMSVLLKNNGYDEINIGIALSMIYIGTMITPILFVKWLKFNIKVTKIFIFILIISLLLINPLVEYYYLFILNMFLFGLSRNVIQIHLENKLINEYPNKYGFLRSFGSIGFFITTLLLGMYYTNYNLNMVIYIIIAFMALFLIFEKEGEKKVEEKESIEFGLISQNLLFWVFIFIFHLSLGFYFSFFSIYLMDFNYEMLNISNAWNISVIGEFIGLLLFVYFRKNITQEMFVILSIIITGIRFLLLDFYPENLYIVLFAQFLHLFTFAIFHINLLEIIKKEFKEHSKMAIKLYFSVGYGASLALGSFLGGFLYSKNIFMILFIINFISLFIFIYWMKKRTKK